MSAPTRPTLIGRAISALRGVPDRARHPKRHAAVCRRLSETVMPRTLLVVCAGNVCRSPYLEAVLKRDLPHVRVASAGFVGFNRPVPPNALAAAARRSIDLSGFRSQTLEPHRARTADLVVVMDERQARYLAAYVGISRSRIVLAGDLDPMVSSSRAIEDPWQQSIDVFVSTFDRLDRCASTLAALLRVGAVPNLAAAWKSESQTQTMAASVERLPQPTL